MDEQPTDNMDEELAQMLRSQFKQDQGIPEEPGPELQMPLSAMLLNDTGGMLNQAAHAIANGNMPAGMITVQMAQVTALMALTRAVQEWSSIFMQAPKVQIITKGQVGVVDGPEEITDEDEVSDL